MKREKEKSEGECVQISYLEDPGGQVFSKEYLLRRGGLVFTIEVVGVPLPSGLGSLQEFEIPPLPMPTSLFEDPVASCNFLLASPLASLNPHLVPEILPEEIKGDIP